MTLSPLVAHVAASMLTDSDRPPFDARDLPNVVEQVRRAKVTGLAVAAMRSGSLVLADEVGEELASAQVALAALALEIDAMTLQALHDLGDDGILVLKGLAHATLDYPDTALREYGDVDLYVVNERIPEVERWFADRGFVRSFGAFAPRWSERFGKSITLSTDRLEVDLHRALSQGVALGVGPRDVMAHRTTFELAGVRVPALDAPARLVHAAIHALGGSEQPPATGLVDLVQMSANSARLGSALELAREWDVAGMLCDAVRLACGTIGVAPTSLEIVAGERGSWNEQLRRRIVGRPGHRFRNDVAAGFLSLRDWGSRVEFARALALPGRGSTGTQ